MLFVTVCVSVKAPKCQEEGQDIRLSSCWLSDEMSFVFPYHNRW